MGVSDFVQKMMFANQLNMEDGRIELLGFRMMMLPTYTFTKLVEELYQRYGDDVFDILFNSGREHGHYATDVLGKEHEIPRRQFTAETLDSSGILGLGRFEAEIINFEEGRLVFRIEDSPFPQEFQNSDILSSLDMPVDHLQRGMLHGIAEDLFDGPVSSKETQCEYLGDSHCKLVVTSDTEEHTE